MRKVILNLAVTLDGYIARENGDVDYLGEMDGELVDSFQRFLDSIDTIIMGRKSYEKTISFGEYPFKDKKTYVLSRSETNIFENVEYINAEVEQLVCALQKNEGKNIWLFGGSEVIKSFVKKDLIDEYQISIVPELIGNGIPLFGENNNNISLATKSIEKYGDTVTIIYERM